MSDRHLYKAKRTDNGEWVEGTPIHTHIGLFICFEENPHYCSQYGYMEIDEIIKVDEKTLCQCIGLKDKSGTLIWENDIVAIKKDEERYLIGWTEDCAKWEIYGSIIHDFDNYCSSELEVIGNIFDNPELLEVQNE